MRPRLLTLLVVAVVSGVIAGYVGNATAGKTPRKPLLGAFQPALARSVTCPIPERFRAAFVSAAEETNLPLALLVAVAQVESQLQPNARSTAGAHGLLQLLPSTAAELHLDPYDPSSNILAGARYLRAMLDRFHSTDLAIAAYNAGPTAVARADGPPTKVTADYVKTVTARWRLINGCT